MSNPYAPKSQLKAKSTAPAPVEPIEPKEVTLEDVPDGSIEDVLKWVDEDPKKAELAVEAELDGKQRTSLVKTLKKVIDA